MKRVGHFLPAAQVKRDANGKRPGAQFAELKELWAIQVAGDRNLPQTALRIALVFPKWLNSKSLKAWPAQSTIAEVINTSERAVRSGLKRLVTGGHLVCLTEKPGGRKSNVYRIVVNDEVIAVLDPANTDAVATKPGTPVPVSPEHGVRAQRNAQSGQSGSVGPLTPEPAFRGTPERTPDKTNTGTSVDGYGNPERERGPRVTAQQVEAILSEVFGGTSVSGEGYVRREG